MNLAGVCSDSIFTRLAAGGSAAAAPRTRAGRRPTTTISPSIDAPLRQVGLDRLDDLGEVTGHRLLVAGADLHLVAVAEDYRAEAVPLRLEATTRRSGSAGTALASIGATGGITGSCMPLIVPDPADGRDESSHGCYSHRLAALRMALFESAR